MGDSKQDVNRKFRQIVESLGFVPSIAHTLESYLWAAPGQHAPSVQAVDYVLGRLWVEDPKKGSAT
ncbi:hypothetical protein SEA_GALACTICA_57 [Streptomyces phage Galactica]|nr:hypothetical protein SEA_GALACTICA_57 [Streptomyces phage Galactica]